MHHEGSSRPQIRRSRLAKMSARPRVFFDFSIGGRDVGRMTFELFDDIVPRTVENFRCLATGKLYFGTLSRAFRARICAPEERCWNSKSKGCYVHWEWPWFFLSFQTKPCDLFFAGNSPKPTINHLATITRLIRKLGHLTKFRACAGLWVDPSHTPHLRHPKHTLHSSRNGPDPSPLTHRLAKKTLRTFRPPPAPFRP